MNGDTGSTCPNCGSPLKEEAAFCTDCGASVGAPEQPAAPPPPPAGAGPPVAPPPPPVGGYAPGAPGQPVAPMAAQKRSKAPLVAAMIVGLLVVAGIAVLVLWLTMWRDDAGGSGEPVALAEQYISAMQAGDVDAYLDCFHEDFFQGEEMDWLKEMGMDLKQVMQMTMDMMDVSFKDYALELEYERGDEARVVTTGGTAVISIFGFEESFDLAEDPMVFEMVRKGGRWYLIDDPLPDSMGGDFDFDDFDDFDFDDFDDFDFGDFDLGDLGFDEADMESLLEILPDGYSLEDLENMSLDELMQLLEELQWLLEDLEDYLPYGAG